MKPQTVRLNTYILQEQLPKRNKEKTLQVLRKMYTSYLEYVTHKIKPNTFKILEHMNIDFKGSANIKPGPSKVIFLHYYKK
jgi:predicted phosphatase